MEDLVRSLRNLGLRPPNAAQLWELLDDDKEVQARLIKLLAFNNADVDDEGQDGMSAGAGVAALMGQDLLQEAVSALLDNFRRTIERQRETTQKEEALLRNDMDAGSSGNGTRKTKTGPKKVKFPPRKALLARQEAALRKDGDERARSQGYRPRLVFDGSQSFFSQSELSNLRRVACCDFEIVPKRYKGGYLLCRVITSPLLYVGITVLVEDPKGAVTPMSVSHLTSDLNMATEEVAALLPIGTILGVKEPLLSIDHQARAGPCTGKADVGLRVDSPTDLVILDAGSAVLKDVAWETTIDSRSAPDLPWRMEDISKRENTASLIERRYDAGRTGAAFRALLRAEQAGQQTDATLKARILYNLGAWKAAKDLFSSLPGQDDQTQDDDKAGDFSVPASELTPSQSARRCTLRQLQSEQGLTQHDVRSIYFAASKVFRFDSSDFIGPVTVQDIPGAGRGLVTTRDVEPGELLLCCRAVGSAYPEDPQSKGSPLLRLNLSNGVVSATSQVRAQTNLIHAITDRPELARSILGLTAGPAVPPSKYVQRPFPMVTLPILAADKALSLAGPPPIDAAYVDGVLRFNAFGPAQSPTRSGAGSMDAGELGKSTMPHPLPAILNHACLPNVASIFFSDMVTTRPLARLPKGTEIVHQYVRGEEPYGIRAAQLSKHGFQCACMLCEMDRADGQEAYTARARIIQGEARAVFERSRVLMKRVDASKIGGERPFIEGEGMQDLDAHQDVLNALEQLQQRVDGTYAAQRGTLRPDLFAIMEVRVKHLALISTGSAVEAVTEAIRCVGGKVVHDKLDERQGVLHELPRLHIDGAIALLLLVAVLYANQASKLHQHQAQAWTQAAFWAHQCMIGGGMDVFLDRWGVPEYRPALRSFTPL